MSALLPNNVVDVSDLREIPDNQEVFVHQGTDQSIIVEILEMVQEGDEQAVRTHFQELASSNDATQDNQVASVEQMAKNQISMDVCESAYYLSGQQLISKFKETAKNVVNIHLALFRIPSKQTDIILTLNDPVNISPQSSSGQVQGEGVPRQDPWTLEHFRLCLQSLKIQNTDFLG